MVSSLAMTFGSSGRTSSQFVFTTASEEMMSVMNDSAEESLGNNRV